MNKHLILACALIALGCGKGSSPSSPIVPPNNPLTEIVSVYTVTPTQGAYATVVTITGSYFNASAQLDTVKFNGIAATVQEASATQLKVLVPLHADTGKITVKVGDQLVTGPVFNYIWTWQVSTIADGVEGIGVTADAQGNILVADNDHNRVRKISTAGVVSTLAGDGNPGTQDGPPATAQFFQPVALTLDALGNIYVADQGNSRIRKIPVSGNVSTYSGNTNGYQDGDITVAKYFYPNGLAFDKTGNLYVGDEDNNRIRKITPAGLVSTLAGHSISGTYPDGGGGMGGYQDGDGSVAIFASPHGIAADPQGSVYVADYINNRIRKITPAGLVTTLAGSSQGYADGNGANAQFDLPQAVTVDTAGNIFVADARNHRIRKITPQGSVSTIAGTGIQGAADGEGSKAQLNFPSGITIDGNGNIFVADYGNHKIRKIVRQ